MLGIIAKNQKETFGATLYSGRDDDQGEYFEFYYAESVRYEDRQHIPNLISDVSYTTIVTSWELDYKNKQYVEIGSEMYKIDDYSIDRNAGRQSANRFGLNPLTEYRLILVGVANPKAVIRHG